MVQSPANSTDPKYSKRIGWHYNLGFGPQQGARTVPEKDTEESIPTPVFDKGTLLWRGQNLC